MAPTYRCGWQLPLARRERLFVRILQCFLFVALSMMFVRTILATLPNAATCEPDRVPKPCRRASAAASRAAPGGSHDACGVWQRRSVAWIRKTRQGKAQEARRSTRWEEVEGEALGLSPESHFRKGMQRVAADRTLDGDGRRRACFGHSRWATLGAHRSLLASRFGRTLTGEVSQWGRR